MVPLLFAAIHCAQAKNRSVPADCSILFSLLSGRHYNTRPSGCKLAEIMGIDSFLAAKCQNCSNAARAPFSLPAAPFPPLQKYFFRSIDILAKRAILYI